MAFPRKEVVEEIKKRYQAGTKVVLKKMDDIQAPPVGTKGLVQYVDDAGSVHIKWDTGSTLAVVYGEDEIAVC